MIVKLTGGEIWLHSPIAYDDAVANALSALGPIRHLVSPNKLHYEHLGAWSAAFPEANVWASPGLQERARSQGVKLNCDWQLGSKAPDAWRNEMCQTTIPGCYLDEAVFFHKASKTLVLTDTIENFELSKIKQPHRFLVWLSGAYSPARANAPGLASDVLAQKAGGAAGRPGNTCVEARAHYRKSWTLHRAECRRGAPLCFSLGAVGEGDCTHWTRLYPRTNPTRSKTWLSVRSAIARALPAPSASTASM